MVGSGGVIGGDVSNSGATKPCQTCGHANPGGSARWCGVCGAELPADAAPSARAVGAANEPSPERRSDDGEPSAGTTARRRFARRSLLAVPVLLLAVLVSAVVLTIGPEELDEAADDTGDDVELPTADALTTTPDAEDPGNAEDPETANGRLEQPGTVRDIAPGAVVWAEQVTTEPLSPTADLEVADGLIVTAERSQEQTEDELAADVFAVDAITGEQMWTRTVTAPWFPATTPGLAVADRWVILADCAQLTGLDLANGEVVWQHRTERQILLNGVAAAPRDDPEVVLIVTSNRSSPRLDWLVMAIDVATGEVRWDLDVVRAAVTPDAAVVLNEDGRVTGLAAATGEPMWETTPDTAASDLFSVAGAILETDDQQGTHGRLRAASDGRLLFDDEVHRHGLPMPGRDEGEHRNEVVTTTAEVALVEDGRVSWTVPQPRATCCVSSHVPAEEGAVAVLGSDDSLMHLDRRDGDVLSHRDAGELQEANMTLAGRFVLAADDPIRDRAGSLRLVDASDPSGWRVVATLSEGQVVAVLPEGDVLVLADEQVHRLTSP
jgi:outer membrane protein assembly factor BamB